jgi:hypothetical protein
MVAILSDHVAISTKVPLKVKEKLEAEFKTIKNFKKSD